MTKRVLVLGGYGVFGGKLARRLVAAGVEVIVAGRSLERAQAFCEAHGGRPMQLDRDGDLNEALAAAQPAIVIDAAGPFQAYGDDPYRVARAAIRAGAHYIDLADDPDFVAGIGTLNDEAAAAGVAVISGASSVPAISSAALDELVQGLADVAVVGSVILPGNRAPRGLSVVQAIVSQAGRPLRLWRGSRWIEEPAWGDLRWVGLDIAGTPGIAPRLASRIGAPDLLLFPERYSARSSLFHASVQLKLMHVGLWLLAWPVRLGLVRSISWLASPLKRMADRLEPFGSDRGGMLAYAIGRDAEGRAIGRRWTMIAEAGDGPETPPTPALLLALKLLRGKRVEPGARPALGLLSLTDIEVELQRFAMRCEVSERAAPPLFEQVLAHDFAALPPAWRRLAEVHDIERFEGVASVERGAGILSSLVGLVMGFPSASKSVAVRVTKGKTRAGETWTRDFGGKVFRSHLSRRTDDARGILRERFGPMSFVMRLRAQGERVHWPLESGSFLGLPLPAFLRPRSDTIEFVDDAGRFNFDVGISLPLMGKVVRYRGWLAPSQEAEMKERRRFRGDASQFDDPFGLER